jgi:uncharacterized protein (TIGR03437 family)
VVVQFGNGNQVLSLGKLGNGMWDGTWDGTLQGPAQAAPVTLTVIATNAAGVTGINVINGALAATTPSPMINNSNGIQNAASLTAGASGAPFVAPGEYISILGQQLSGGQLPAGSGTFPTQLAGTTVLISLQLGSANGQFQAMPLQFVSGGQVNALVPYGTSVNTPQEILLQWGDKYAKGVGVNVAAAQPGIFQYGSQQGIITDAKGNLVGPSNPAHTGDPVVIYCTGLGAVTPGVSDGAVTPSSPVSQVQTPVTVMIGEQPASVLFAGLTPTVNGLYQINATVPQGVSSGDQVPVKVSAADQTSAVVFTSVR